MKKSYLFGALLAALALTACSWPPVGEKNTAYVNSYEQVADLFVSVHQGTDGRPYLRVYFEDPVGYGPSTAEFRRLSEEYGDEGYEREYYWEFGPSCFYPECFQSIDIVSTQEFNGRPSGTSLADVVMVVGLTAAPYVESGYTAEFDWENDVPSYYALLDENDRGEERIKGVAPFVKPLSEFTSADLRLLLVTPFCLVFTEEPAIRQHMFSVTLRDPEGYPHRSHREVDFDAPEEP